MIGIMTALIIITIVVLGSLITITTRSETMLQGKSLKMKAYKKTDIIKQYMIGTREAATQAYIDYLADGYTVYDVVAEVGFANLAGKAPGKYICVFKNGSPSASYNVQNTYISPHTAVIITGMQLDTNDTLIDYNLAYTVNMPLADNFGDKLSLQYGEFSLSASTSSNFEIKNSIVSNNGFLNDVNISNTQFKLYPGFLKYTRDTEIENTTFENTTPGHNTGFAITGTKTLKFTNCILSNNPISATAFFYFSMVGVGSVTLNFENTYAKNTGLELSDMSTDDNSVIYVYNTTFGASTSNYKIINRQLVSVIPNIQSRIEFTDIDFSTFVDFDADWKHESINKTNFWMGIQHVDYYTALFFDDHLLIEELKKFSKGYWFVVRRDDFDDTLVDGASGAFKIKQNTLYENDGTTLADFQAMENFLIKATDGTDTAVFLYMDNVLYGTVYSDVWNDRTYTIQQCFQLWEVDKFEGVSNTIKKYNEPKAITNSPCSGSVRFNNQDNEIKVRQ